MALQKYPGFIDAHVHLRDPGATHKEDFRSGTRAALVGGITFVIDMPNNPTPTFHMAQLKEKIGLARQKAVCDVGFHFGTDGKNMQEFERAAKNSHVFGLKVYCNHTTGDFLIEDEMLLENAFASWTYEKPILVHAEGSSLAKAIDLAKQYGRRLHVCHISQASEVAMVSHAKRKKLPVTAGVTPHHLFLTKEDGVKGGSHALMKPPLGTKKDQDALWEGLQDQTIDIVETDHAPHTKEEKKSSTPPFGVPGLETVAGLLFKAVYEKRLKASDVTRLLFTKPKEIFATPDQPNTYIELDPDSPYSIGQGGYETKCGWSPFDGWQAYGKVKKVVFKGKIVVNDATLVI